MKLLTYLVVLGVTLYEVCNAHSCTTDEIEFLSITFSSCTNNASCFLDLCGCCAEALNAGITNENYNCCLAYSSLTQCQVSNVPFCKECLADVITSGSGSTDSKPVEAASCYCLPDVVMETDPTTGTLLTTTQVTPTSGKSPTSAAVTTTFAVSGVTALLHVYRVALWITPVQDWTENMNRITCYVLNVADLRVYVLKTM